MQFKSLHQTRLSDHTSHSFCILQIPAGNKYQIQVFKRVSPSYVYKAIDTLIEIRWHAENYSYDFNHNTFKNPTAVSHNTHPMQSYSSKVVRLSRVQWLPLYRLQPEVKEEITPDRIKNTHFTAISQ